jgi:uncharacterized SAM-dependent methyltransferase
MSDIFFMYDETEDTRTRFVGFIGESKRFDLSLTNSNHFFGKTLVHDIQSGRSAIIGQDDLKEEGYLEHAYNLTEEEAAELLSFLEQVIS